VAGPFSTPETRIAIVYVLLASLWIIGSDSLLSRVVGHEAETVYFQTFKGLNFVVTTGLLLFFTLRRAYGGWRKSEELRMASMRAARERFHNLSSRIQNLREEERTKISREVHDELGQLLTGIKMQLRLIENHLNDRDDRSLNPMIDDLVETSGMIDETIMSVQRISSGLRPLSLDHLGLAAALDEEAGQFSRRTGIECHLSVGEMDDPIPPNVETAAFRIFQESLTNVARHADAGRIDAECSMAGDVLKLIVQDDGVGINPVAIESPESLGIVGMLERAADAGGKVEFDSASGHGTKVVLTIPLPSNARPQLARRP
jgi:signal transduction histidine kinase